GKGPSPGRAPHEQVAELAEAASTACRRTRLPALVGVLDQSPSPGVGIGARVGMLVSLPARDDAERSLAELARRIRALCSRDPVLAAGSVVESVRDVRRSFLEAEQVADAARRGC